MDKKHVEGANKGAANTMKDDHKLPPDSKMQKAVDQAEAIGGDDEKEAKDALRHLKQEGNRR
jgi:hypothetical protein